MSEHLLRLMLAVAAVLTIAACTVLAALEVAAW